MDILNALLWIISCGPNVEINGLSLIFQYFYFLELIQFKLLHFFVIDPEIILKINDPLCDCCPREGVSFKQQ